MRFNTPAATLTRTINRAGGEAFGQDHKTEFTSLILTSFLNDQFYRSAKEQLAKIQELTAKDPLFAARLAVYARNEFGMRSVTHVIAGEVSRNVKGQKWAKYFYDRVVRRPDDITEILSYTGKPIPNSMKKGFGFALGRFDAYQLGKYKGVGNSMSLVDAVNLCRPKHTDQIKALVDGTLPVPQTWEAGLTQAGNDADAKAQVWASLISERKIGYMALLRNLKNIMQQAPASLDAALEMLTDDALIKKSLVLPFRFYVGIKRLQQEQGANNVIAAMSKALDIAVNNIPALDGSTLVVVDRSGSMESPVTMNNSMSCAELGCLFGFALAKSTGADVVIFGDTAKYLSFNPGDSIASLTNWGANSINKNGWGRGSEPYNVGHGTNFHAALDVANKPYDRIVYFSDMQGWIGHSVPVHSLANYEKRTGAMPKIFSFDLTGYGTMQFPSDRIKCIAGFSDKVFDLMAALENGEGSLVSEIESVSLH